LYHLIDLTEENSTVEAGFEATLLAKKLNFNVVAFIERERTLLGFILIQQPMRQTMLI
jgi:hypothetical protein